jgi:hypothetical protein
VLNMILRTHQIQENIFRRLAQEWKITNIFGETTFCSNELQLCFFAPMNYHFVSKNSFRQSKPLIQTVKVTMPYSLRGQSDNAL